MLTLSDKEIQNIDYLEKTNTKKIANHVYYCLKVHFKHDNRILSLMYDNRNERNYYYKHLYYLKSISNKMRGI